MPRCEMAQDYALERYAFGRPIGSFQAIKHKLADMYVTERASPVQRLLRRLGAGDRRRRAAAGRRRRAGFAPREAFTARRRRTSRRMAASASPGRSTATSTTAASKLLGLVAGRRAALEGPAGQRWKPERGNGAAADRHRHSCGRRGALEGTHTMDFNDTPGGSRIPRRGPRLARCQCRAARPAPRPVLRLRRHGRRRGGARQGLAGEEGRGRLRRHHLAEGMRRRAAARRCSRSSSTRKRRDYAVPRGLFEIGLGMCIPTLMTYAKPEQLDALCAPGAARRGDLVPAVLRTRRRLRPCRRCAPARNATATTGSSTARRSGPPARISPTSASSSRAPTPTCRSMRA